MRTRVTLAEIAAVLGVTKTTVSRALREDRGISVATRLRVAEAAKRLGYRPDAMLSAAASLRWRNHSAERGYAIVHLLDVAPPYERYFTEEEHYQGAWLTGRQFGYANESVNAAMYTSPLGLIRAIDGRGAAGIIVHPCMRDDWFDALPWDRWLAVMVGLSSRWGAEKAPRLTVSADTSLVMDDLANSLVRSGTGRVHAVVFEEMAGLRGLHRAPLAHLIEAGSRYGGLHVEEVRMPAVPGDSPPPAFAEWLEQTRPEVILGSNNTVYWWLRTLGRKMPDDLRYASFIRTLQDSDANRISACDTHLHDQGRTSVELLDGLVRQHRRDVPHLGTTLQIHAHWFSGETLGLGGIGPR